MQKIRWVLLLSAVLGLAGMAGCGQKGPLYLPDESDSKQEQAK